MNDAVPVRVGVIGTGFVSHHFAIEIERRKTYRLGPVLTRRPLKSCGSYRAPDRLTHDLDEVIANSDIVFECTGDAHYAAQTVGRVLDAGIPVVTLNSEFHVTIGSHFVGRGLLSEAEGDQPGCIAALAEDTVAMGFEPLAYVNMKAFLNRGPTREDMEFWAAKQNYSMAMVTSFTDGTKVQIEQCLVANGLGAGIAREDLLGPQTGDLNEGARILGDAARQVGYPISDYVLDRGLPHGVFVVARHDDAQSLALQNLKMGAGPYYVLKADYCLVHLEVFKTIERLLTQKQPLLNNSACPRISVASIAKRTLQPGEIVERGAGGFDLRGSCVNIVDRLGHVPICLAANMRVRQRIEPGQIVTFDDIELPDSEALSAWRAIEARCVEARKAS